MRTLTVGVQNAIAEAVIRPVYFVRLEFGVSTVLYLTDRGANITWNFQTWLGNGWLQPIKTIEETADVKAVGCEITLNGSIPELITHALSDARLSNRGKVWLGFLDSSGALIADPLLVFSGFLDMPRLESDGGEQTIKLSYENELRGLMRSTEFRYTDQAQQSLFPGDKGFKYCEAMETWDGYWGKPEKPTWLKRRSEK